LDGGKCLDTAMWYTKHQMPDYVKIFLRGQSLLKIRA